MNIKMAINLLSTIEYKKQTKQISRTKTGSQIRRLFGGLSGEGSGEGENWGKGAGIRYKLVGTKQTGDVKDTTGNGEAKELICMT